MDGKGPTPKTTNISIHFDQLSVNSVDTNSGIFIGTYNAAHGWSSHSKSNRGFGSASSSNISRCTNIIFDDDLIDSPIEDSDQFTICTPKSDEHLNCNVSFTDINVNALQTNSSISVGDVEQTGWSSHKKTNSGVGGMTGINTIHKDLAVIFDNDVMDAPIKSSSHFSNASKEPDSA